MWFRTCRTCQFSLCECPHFLQRPEHSATILIQFSSSTPVLHVHTPHVTRSKDHAPFTTPIDSSSFCVAVLRACTLSRCCDWGSFALHMRCWHKGGGRDGQEERVFITRERRSVLDLNWREALSDGAPTETSGAAAIWLAAALAAQLAAWPRVGRWRRGAAFADARPADRPGACSERTEHGTHKSHMRART